MKNLLSGTWKLPFFAKKKREKTKTPQIYRSVSDLTKKNHSGCPVTQDDFTSVGCTPENELADNQTYLAWAFPHLLLLSLCKCTRIRIWIEQRLFDFLGNVGYKFFASASTGFWLWQRLNIGSSHHKDWSEKDFPWSILYTRYVLSKKKKQNPHSVSEFKLQSKRRERDGTSVPHVRHD